MVGGVLLLAGSSEDAYLPRAQGVEAGSGPTASSPEALEKAAKAMRRVPRAGEFLWSSWVGESLARRQTPAHQAGEDWGVVWPAARGWGSVGLSWASWRNP